MRFHQINVENLNSLYDRHELDLDGPLGDAALFLIEGPTGSGKTTILDAVSLALYGTTPRLQDVGRAEDRAATILSHGTGQGEAEVVFSRPEPEGGRVWYRATWTAWRAHERPGGRIQTPERELARRETPDEDWTILVTSDVQKEFEPHFEEALREMEAEDFWRSVLLAQGEFAAFLQADAREKASILERLTGTDDYEAIGRRAYERRREARDRRDEVEEELAAYDEDLEAEPGELEETIEALEEEVAQIREQLAVLGEQRAWFDEVAQRQETVVEGRERRDSLREALEDADEELQTLEEEVREVEQAIEEAEGERRDLREEIRVEGAKLVDGLRECGLEVPADPEFVPDADDPFDPGGGSVAPATGSTSSTGWTRRSKRRPIGSTSWRARSSRWSAMPKMRATVSRSWRRRCRRCARRSRNWRIGAPTCSTAATRTRSSRSSTPPWRMPKRPSSRCRRRSRKRRPGSTGRRASSRKRGRRSSRPSPRSRRHASSSRRRCRSCRSRTGRWWPRR
ncbi:MAG: AAA family ATPase [Bradymonadaceae bacterium]